MTGRFWIGKYCAEGHNLGPNELEKVVDFATATTGAIASKELFTVTGEVLATVVPICETTALTGGATATIEYGVAGDTDLFVGAITATTWDVGEIGINVTPLAYLVVSDTQPKWAYLSDVDIGYEVKLATIDTGRVRWYCLWYPLSTDANVEVAGVNVTL